VFYLCQVGTQYEPEAAVVNNDQAPPTFIFAPEIEQALVAAAFQCPERIALIYRELDPSIHFTDQALRHILAAIDLAYRELGSTDFASVIQVLREENKLEACGGPAGVNSALEEYRYGFSDPEAAKVIINHYIEILKTYAANRKIDPPQPIRRFLRGKGTMTLNKGKRRESDPDFIGEAYVSGRFYVAKAWTAENGCFVNFYLEPQL
jgi:hypothetical protein